MKRSPILIYLLLLAQLTLLSCQSTTKKMNSFVTSYNKGISQYETSLMTFSKAKALFNEKIIELNYETSFTIEETKDGMMNRFLESTFVRLLDHEALSKELINEGVVFKVSFSTRTGYEFLSLVVDKNKLIELKKKLKNDANGDASLGLAKTRMNNSPAQVALSLLNESLPSVDKETGFSILKIDINAANELIYNVRVPSKLAPGIKGKDASNLFKEDILRGGGMNNFVDIFRRLHVKKIIYSLKDEQDRYLNEVVLTPADLNL